MCGNYSWAETIWGNTVASFSNTSFHTVLYCNTECIFNQPLSKIPGRTFSLLFWSSALHIRPFVVNCPITGILTSKVIKNNPKLSLTYKNSIWILRKICLLEHLIIEQKIPLLVLCGHAQQPNNIAKVEHLALTILHSLLPDLIK